jgi:adenine phosphoribosyltransferase
MNDPFLYPFIKDVPDFPKPGIVFKDIAPLLASAEARAKTTSLLAASFKKEKIDVVVGIESRGFLFGMLLADALGARFVMVRKPGKLPGETMCEPYELEYGFDSLEIQENAIKEGENVLIHDDVLATGGTAAAASRLVEKVGGTVAGFNFIIELEFLKGLQKINNHKTVSILKY